MASLSSMLVNIALAHPNTYCGKARLSLKILPLSFCSCLLLQALGRHEADMAFRAIPVSAYGGTVQQQKQVVYAEVGLHVQGSSLVLGKHRSLPGGAEAVPETFMKET